MSPPPKELFAALAHQTRLRCMLLLIANDELCVCELTHATGMAQPHISRHLAHLRAAGLIVDKRKGIWIHYRVNPAIPAWIENLLQQTASGLIAQPPFSNDQKNLRSMPNRPNATQCISDPIKSKEATMNDRIYNVLFLCTGNSARSILGEKLVEQLGGGRFRGFSAGSNPKPEVNPLALEILRRNNYSTTGLRSKSWDEFSRQGAPIMDFVFTVCDNAANETCPIWLEQPMTAHWGIADPAAVEGSETTRMMAFRKALHELEKRIGIFVNLPIDSLDKLKIQERIEQIGKISSADQAVEFTSN